MKTPYFLDLISFGLFAVSGTLAAGRKSLDLIGASVIAVVTAIGGGTVRDLLLNRHPIFWTADPFFLYVIAAAVLVTLVYVRFRPPPDQALRIADAIGLSVYTIVGTYLAKGSGRPAAIAVVMGTITGTAGGVIRDMLCNDVPIIFRKGYLYATAAIIRATIYVLLQEPLGQKRAAYLGMVVIAVLRLRAIVFRWNLPRFRPSELGA